MVLAEYLRYIFAGNGPDRGPLGHYRWLLLLSKGSPDGLKVAEIDCITRTLL